MIPHSFGIPNSICIFLWVFYNHFYQTIRKLDEIESTNAIAGLSA